MAHHNQLSAFGVCFACLPSQMGSPVRHGQYGENKDDICRNEREGEYKWRRDVQISELESLEARHAENHKPAKQISSVRRSSLLSGSAIKMSASRAITFQK